jgi:sensor domain CHASE-containing protein
MFVTEDTGSRDYNLSGPIRLPQGIEALLIRPALVTLNAETNSEVFLGTASIIIDLKALIEEASYVDLNRDFAIPIRRSDESRTQSELLVGHQDTFNSSLAVTDILLPNGNWQLGVASKKLYRSASVMLSS